MLKKIRQHFASPINKKAASITALVLIALAIPLTVFISQQQQEIRQRAQEVATKGGGEYVSLTLAPSILEKAPGETFDVEFYFEAKTFSITGVDITINYNPSILQIERFTPVSIFNNVLINKSISNDIKGIYRYAAVDTTNAPQTGKITIGIVTFKAQNTTGTSYVDLNNIQITALGQSSAIPTADNTQGKYAVAIPTPTPTTAPTETPIPTTPEPVSSCATLYNKIIKTFGNSCGDGSYDKAADLNKDKRISSVDYSKFLTYSNNATTCENALNDQTDPCTTPATTTAPAQPTPTFTPSPSPTPTPVVIQGDANGDGTVDILDFNIWRDEFLLTFGKPTTLRADFNKDDRVDLLDFSIWRNAITITSHPPITAAPTIEPSSPSAGFGKALKISSSSQDAYITAPSFTGPLNFGVLAIGVWIKPSFESLSGTNSYVVLGKEFLSGEASGYRLSLVNKKVEFQIAQRQSSNTQPTYVLVKSLSTLEAEKWYYVSIVAVPDSTLYLNVNGTNEAAQTIGAIYDPSDRQLIIGCARPKGFSGCVSQFYGILDEILISQEVNPNPQLSPLTPNDRTIALYHLDEDARDASSHALNGQMVGNIEFVNSTISVSSQ